MKNIVDIFTVKVNIYIVAYGSIQKMNVRFVFIVQRPENSIKTAKVKAPNITLSLYFLEFLVKNTIILDFIIGKERKNYVEVIGTPQFLDIPQFLRFGSVELNYHCCYATTNQIKE